MTCFSKRIHPCTCTYPAYIYGFGICIASHKDIEVTHFFSKYFVQDPFKKFGQLNIGKGVYDIYNYASEFMSKFRDKIGCFVNALSIFD